MVKSNLCLVLDNVNGFSYSIDLAGQTGTVEAVGKLLASSLSGQALEGVTMTSTFPVSFLQIARLGFFIRHGVFLERPYISLA